VIAFHAVVSLGGTFTTINPAATTEELASQLIDAGATALLTVPQCLERAAPAAAQARLREVFVFGDAAGYTPFAELLAGSGSPPPVSISPSDDVAVLPYSSGTTGLPKGVMLTHRNLVANVMQVAATEPVSERDTLIAVLPFFHIYGLKVLMNYGLAVGATIVTMPRFALEPFLQLLQDHGVTRAYLAPPTVLALANQPVVTRYDLSRLAVIVSGGAPLAADVATACQERIGCYVKYGYGMTESSAGISLGPADPNRNRVGTIGPLFPNTEAMVVDPVSGLALGPGQLGELWVRGPQVMKGYLHQPEATARTITADGWLRTGDLGQMDEDGYLAIVDRLKELIKYKAYQIAPAELEAILLSHPAVADVAVIPSPDEEAGEVPKAFVVRKEEATPEELMAFVAAHVAPYKKVRRLEFIEQIPKSASGKILRRVLVERERALVLAPA
jgi:acyl-CoA synthetase (AMP-forming)/AMP-acid ligase II